MGLMRCWCGLPLAHFARILVAGGLLIAGVMIFSWLLMNLYRYLTWRRP